MSDLVMGLAKKRRKLAEQRAVEDPTSFKSRIDEARWWLNAIADEITMDLGSPMGCQDVADWIRGESR